MKGLQVNCVYKNGSTEKIVYDIHTELKKNGIELIVSYGRSQKEHEENVYKQIEVENKNIGKLVKESKELYSKEITYEGYMKIYGNL